MPKLEKPAEGHCDVCRTKVVLENGKVADHKDWNRPIGACPGVGAVVAPIKGKRRKS